MVTFADDRSVSFGSYRGNDVPQDLATFPLDALQADGHESKRLAREAKQSIHQLLVVPDYWLGSRVDAFQSRKKSLINAFIERKLTQNQPVLDETTDFYNYAVVKGNNRQRELYTYYLQEHTAYGLHRWMKTLGVTPRRITTPALLWQSRLADLVQGFDKSGIGFVYLVGAVCYLYFFFRGQFLFSRTIELTETGDEPAEIYGQLNYEINQSFYLFSQKAKSSVDALYLSAKDPEVAVQLTALSGRDILELPFFPSHYRDGEGEWVPPSCRSFSRADLNRSDLFTISHKPLKVELYWQPVQWAGIAVGCVLIALLAVESLFLQSRLGDANRQMQSMAAASAQPPAEIFHRTSVSIDKARQALERKSGSETAIQAILAETDAVSITKLSLDLSSGAHLAVRAVVHADDPETFTSVLRFFLDRLNKGLQLNARPLEEKDVKIFLERFRGDRKAPEYKIEIEIGLT